MRIAVPTVLYAPLYVAIESSKAKFHVEVPDKKSHILATQRHSRRKALAPIEWDPVFSPVIDPSHFQNYPRDWFAVGDPLRVRRLAECHGTALRYKYVGTLITKLAYWAIAPSTSQLDRPETFNYVVCHTPGMTGYYLAELLFRAKAGHNPLASFQPGLETHHFFRMVAADKWRRDFVALTDSNDPIVFAALTTEIGHLLAHLREPLPRPQPFETLEPLFRYGLAHTLFPQRGLASADFIMTAICRRANTKDEAQIDELATALRESIKDAIALLHSDRGEFKRRLVQFYDNHPTFNTPTKNKNIDRQLDDTLDHLCQIYPVNGLVASRQAKAETDKLIKASVRVDTAYAGRSARKQTVEGEFLKLCTDTWGGDGTLWQ